MRALLRPLFPLKRPQKEPRGGRRCHFLGTPGDGRGHGGGARWPHHFMRNMRSPQESVAPMIFSGSSPRSKPRAMSLLCAVWGEKAAFWGSRSCRRPPGRRGRAAPRGDGVGDSPVAMVALGGDWVLCRGTGCQSHHRVPPKNRGDPKFLSPSLGACPHNADPRCPPKIVVTSGVCPHHGDTMSLFPSPCPSPHHCVPPQNPGDPRFLSPSQGSCPIVVTPCPSPNHCPPPQNPGDTGCQPHPHTPIPTSPPNPR